MSVPFTELAGSPREEYTLNGFRARRTFLVRWEDRRAFAAELLGSADGVTGRPWSPYPGTSGVFAVAVRFEPVEPETLRPQELLDATSELNDYSGSFAKAIVEYRTILPQDRHDGPAPPDGTHITYRMECTTETMAVDRAGWYAADRPGEPLPGDAPWMRIVPTTDHRLTWRQVVDPPWTAIRALQGKVNASEFLGCTPGTLLFAGATANKLYRGSFEEGASSFCWEIDYLFRERAIKQGGQVWGWNYVYRADPPGWVELRNDAGPFYEAGDFSALFAPEP
ncbi:hypothetical protein JCM19992_02770 [Thermostilla marina]